MFHFDSSYQLGIVFGIVSSAFASLYTIYSEKFVNSYDSKVINYYQMMGGTFVLGLLLPVYLYFFPVENILPNVEDVMYLILLSIFCTVGLYVAVTEVMKKISAFTVNLSFNLEPVYAIIIAFLFFNEGKEVNFSFYVGLLFIMLSVVLQSFISIKKSK